jgi:hypothetical protein
MDEAPFGRPLRLRNVIIELIPQKSIQIYTNISLYNN